MEKKAELAKVIIAAVAAVITALIELLGKIPALEIEIGKLPPWVLWTVCAALSLLAIKWFFAWRARHSRLLRADALRLNRDNIEHLVGRSDEAEKLLQLCSAKQIVFLEGESGSGKSALVRSGLVPGLRKTRAILPIMLSDLWGEDWERSPFEALKNALINSGIYSSEAGGKSPKKQAQLPTPAMSTFEDMEKELTRIKDQDQRTPLIIFDQFDDYQAANRERFLPENNWLDPKSLQQRNPFWEMVSGLLHRGKVSCLFVARSDAAAGLASVQFLGTVEPMHLDRVGSQYIAELLTKLTEDKPPPKKDEPAIKVIEDPEAGWNKLKERIIHDIAQKGVVLPQQLKIILGGVQSLANRLNVVEYLRAGGAAGLEALYVEQQIDKTARSAKMDAGQVRAILVELIDPVTLSNPAESKTRYCSKEALDAAARRTSPALTPEQLDTALRELQHGEMIRSVGDPEAYRLDHDYLTRGVLAAERRANRWRYILEDGAKAFADATSFSRRWDALLPIRTQVRIAWERWWVRGTFRYGQQRNYALLSAAPIALTVAVIGVGWWKYQGWRAENAAHEIAASIWRKFEFAGFSRDQDLDGAWMLASADNQVREQFLKELLGSPEYANRFLRAPELVVQALAGLDSKAREKFASSVSEYLTKDRYETAEIAAAAIATQLGKAENVRPRAVAEAIKTPRLPQQLDALVQVALVLSPKVMAEDANALAVALIDNIKGASRSSRSWGPAPDPRVQALRAVVVRLEPRDAAVLANTILMTVDDIGSVGYNLSTVLNDLIHLLNAEDAFKLTDSIVKTILGRTLQGVSLSELLKQLAPQLNADQIHTFALATIDAIKNHRRRDQIGSLLQGFADKFGQDDVRAIARTIVEEITKVNAYTEFIALASEFENLRQERISDTDRNVLAEQIIVAMKRNPTQLAILAAGLSVIRPYMSQQDASELTHLLIQAIKDTPDAKQRFLLASGLKFVAYQTGQFENRDLASIVELVQTATDRSGLRALAPAIEAIAFRLNSPDADIVMAAILGVPEDNRVATMPGGDVLDLQYEEIRALGRSFARVLPLLNFEQIRATAISVTQKLLDPREARFGQELVSEIGDLEPSLAYAFATPIVEALKDKRIVEAQRTSCPDLRQAIERLTYRLTSGERHPLADSIASGIKNANSDQEIDCLLSALAAIAREMKGGDADMIAGPVIEAIRKQAALRQPGGGAAPPSKIEQPIAMIIETLGSTSDSYAGLLGIVLEQLATRVNAEDARLLSILIVDAVKLTAQRYYPAGYLVDTFGSVVAPRLSSKDIPLLAQAILSAVAAQNNPQMPIKMLIALGQQQSWPERLNLFVSALKYPTVYGESREMLLAAIKRDPVAKAIKAPADFWAVIEWLGNQQGIDLTKPAERTKSFSS